MTIASDVFDRVYADPAARLAANALRGVGGEVYAVGGVVRDVTLGVSSTDVDLMVTGLGPERVQLALESVPGSRTDYTGKDFGVFRLKTTGGAVEVALPRTDVDRQDVTVDDTLTVEDDLARRDFTVNSMAVKLFGTRFLIDLHGGLRHAEQLELVTMGRDSMRRDPLRTMRGLVLASRFGLTPDAFTRDAMSEFAPGVADLSRERVQMELDKLLRASDPARGVLLARETGVLRYFLPDVDVVWSHDQNNPHHELRLGDHLLETLRRASTITADPDVRLAALLHDVGKPASEWRDPVTGSSHYYHDRETGQGADHAEVGAIIIDGLLRDLRWPDARRHRVTRLVREHMFGPFTTLGGARRFMAAHGDDVDALLDLREADSGSKPSDLEPVSTMRDLVATARQRRDAVSRRHLAITGDDVLALGAQRGPVVGSVLDRLLRRVIEEPALNERRTLLWLADEMLWG